MQVQYKQIPPDIKEYYNLKDKVTVHGYIYIYIKKGMYDLKQAAILAYNTLQRKLNPFGYAPVIGTVDIRQHEARPTTFCLCVDDFGIKCNTKQHIQHLLDTIGTNCKYRCDWTGSNYCWFTLEWNYEYGYVDISMPGYVEKL